MAKHVFRPTEIHNLAQKVAIDPPKFEVEVEEEIEPIDDLPTESLEDVKLEIEEYKQRWEEEKAQMIQLAKAEAERIIKDAEQVAFDEVQKKTNQVQKTRQEAQDEAKRLVDEAKAEANEILSEAKEKIGEIESGAYERGYKEGHDKGFDAGKNEVQRLVDRLHLILTKAIDRRNEIVEESETQLINLVLQISKKVIKVISENQKNVVINNVVQALRKLKGRGDVVLRVNMADLELASENMTQFQNMVENVKNISILEDSSVDRGGCIIETDFGQIDARISSQLHELESKILEMMPIKIKKEG
ncbi:MAG: flagellar assembly protein FliH [Spirochaetales bacterium]|nr:flagellar assembly protein FliH [Spirochaetales bacterium]